MKVKFPGITTKFQGQQRSSDESTAEMKKYFGVAFLLMILLIMLHFKSFSKAAIIILMIPLAWLGATWGHGVERIPVSMLSAWGMVALSGVIINDAVVFLSKYNRLLLEGQKVVDAVYNAGIARFRPIVLTTLTTVLGLYPIIFEKSFQAQFLKPMAVSLAYGVLVGTAFILVLFPAIILVLNDFKIYSRYVFKQVKYFFLFDIKRVEISEEEKNEFNRVPSREEVEEVIIYAKQKI
jgi:multidrug efflux pump subunit AcrB